MSDMGELFNEWKKLKQEKRQSNLQFSTELLKASGFEFESKNNGVHLIVTTGRGKIDFWPSTGLFQARWNGWQGRGIRNLLKTLEQVK